jgi:hypothetical protein
VGDFRIVGLLCAIEIGPTETGFTFLFLRTSKIEIEHHQKPFLSFQKNSLLLLQNAIKTDAIIHNSRFCALSINSGATAVNAADYC